MTRDELIALAAPPCRRCERPVQRVEMAWDVNGDGDWVPARPVMVCTDGHRSPVELLPHIAAARDQEWPSP